MKIFLLFSFVCFVQVIAIIFSRTKQSKSLKSYYIGDNDISVLYLTISIISLLFGGGLIVGAAEEASKYGWIFSLYPLGICLGLISIGCLSGKLLKKFNVSTVSEILELKYGSQELRNLSSFISSVSLFFILIAQMVASRSFLYSCGIENNLLFILFWFLVFGYVVSGGFEAIVKASIIQASFLALSLVLALFSTFSMGEVTKLITFKVSFFQSDLKPSVILSWLIAPILFLSISQDVAQRSFAAKSTADVFKANVAAALILFALSLIPIYLGITGSALGVANEGNSSILLETLMVTTSPLIASMVGGGVIIAITSSAGSLINAISSNISQGFELKNYFQKNILTRGISLFVAVVALGSSFLFTSTFYILLFGYELLVSCLFIPVFMGICFSGYSATSALFSMVAGTLSFIYFHFFYTPFWLPCEVSAVLVALGFFFIGEARLYLSRVYKKKYT